MLDYKLIEALAMVVQEGGFDKAARVLNLTQSAVSQRVKLLEEHTGQVLLARTAPPRATPAGTRMLKHYQQVLRLEEDLLESLAPLPGQNFSSLAVGINADSLSTWFFEAVRPFLERQPVVLDLRPDDQEQTHRLLREGKVVGCISAQSNPVQGCSVAYLGRMDYRLLATPDFAARWFPEGLGPAGVARAPLLVFNRKDELQHRLLRKVLGKIPEPLPTHYFPSSEKYPDFICAGLAYGMLPEHQNAPLLKAGQLVDLAPGCSIAVKLFWHCWNIRSRLLEELTRTLVARASLFLKR